VRPFCQSADDGRYWQISDNDQGAPPPNARRLCGATATAPRCGCATWPRSSA